MKLTRREIVAKWWFYRGKATDHFIRKVCKSLVPEQNLEIGIFLHELDLARRGPKRTHHMRSPRIGGQRN